jgi:hypothetical protein
MAETYFTYMPIPMATGMNPSAAPSTHNTMNGSTLRAAWIFIAEKTITADRIRVGISSRTNPPVYRIGFQELTGANPSGTWISSATFTPSGFPLVQEITGLSASLTKGVPYAVVVQYESGTIGASNHATFFSGWQTLFSAAIPRPAWFNGTSWSDVFRHALIGYGTATQRFGCVSTSSSAHTATSGTWIGMKFTVPSSIATSVSLAGMRLFSTPPSGATLSYAVYQGGLVTDTTALASGTIPVNALQAGTGTYRPIYFTFNQTLTPGTTYRIAFTVNTGTLFLYSSLGSSTNDDAAMMNPFSATLTTRTSGNWTDNAQTIMDFQPIFNDITTGAGGGVILPHYANGL